MTDPSSSPEATTTRQHVRGSSLLFGGRLIAMLINFAVQVLTVRYLSKSDFGALAWGLAVVAVTTNLNLMGMGRALPRFLAVFEERGDRGAARGTIWVGVASVLCLGLAIVCTTIGAKSVLVEPLSNDPLAADLLIVLIALTPLTACDNLLQGMAATLVGARAIFYRRHVLGPLLKLLAILAVMAIEGSVHVLAWVHVAVGAIGIVAYIGLLVRASRTRGLLAAAGSSLRLPMRPMFTFALPLLAMDLIQVLKVNLATMILQSAHGTEAVATFRVVVPVAGLILIVPESFRLLFLPAASRLWAKGAAKELNELYQQTVVWVTILSFPAFAGCLYLAEPITELLFGARYRESAEVLRILAVGTYFATTVGFNLQMLQVYSRTGYLAMVSAVAGLTAVGVGLWLIPRYGAVGAAIATLATELLIGGLNQVGVWIYGRIPKNQARRRQPYWFVLGAIGALAVLEQTVAPPPLVMAAAIVLAFVVLVQSNRHALDLAGTFPELARFKRRWRGPRNPENSP